MSKVQRHNALLEIGCEEIPARFMPGFLEDLKSKAEEKLKSERISFGKVETLGTYRRLVLYIEDISPRQADMVEEVQGPPAEVAFDKDNKPTQAALGFAKKYKIKLNALRIKTVGAKNYVSASVIKKGLPTAKVLSKLFPEIIESLYLPLSMRWGEGDFKFIRPIHWILALCGRKIIKFELGGIKSSNRTFGHRYARNPKSEIPGRAGLNPKQIPNPKSKIQNANLEIYKKTLLKLKVMVDQNERKKLIRKKVEATAKRIGATALVEEDLLNEVNFLVEYPEVYVGEFNKKFLDIPQEVLITSMKKNQKYFALIDSQKNLLPKFIVVSDGCLNPKIVEGNSRVLSARLSDAKFFFEEDKKIPLASRIPELEKIAYFEKLGTVYHRCERIGKLAQWIGKKFGLEEENLEIIRRIAQLCKADLTTKMVYEFPELQGIVGKIYAEISGEDKRVAAGIFEHYLPRFAEDNLPENLEGICVSLADRIDQLVGCFSLAHIPTGSEDPYGLRRAVHGIIRILLEKKLELLWDEAISESYHLYEPVFLGYLFEKGETGYQDFPKIKNGILEFVAARLRPILLEEGIRYDIADAILSTFNDVLGVLEKSRVLNRLKEESYFPGIVASADRIYRILKEVPREEVKETDLIEEEEKKMYELYLKVNWEVGEAINSRNYEKAVLSLSKFTEPLEVFFDEVLVMHEDEKLRINRLALLNSLQKLYLEVADFRKVVL